MELRIKQQNGYYGVVANHGIIVIPFEYDEIIRTFSSGMILACKNRLWGYLDLSGNVLIPFEYDWIMPFGRDDNCVSNAKKDGKWGIINKKGEAVLPIIYDNEVVFNDGIASVSVNGERGIINERGELLITMIFDQEIIFNSGLATVSINNKWGVIDKKGKTRIPLEYDSLQILVNIPLIVKVSINGKYGVINEEGRTICPIEYDDIGKELQGFIVVKKEGLWGLVDYFGNVRIPFEYNSISRSDDNGVFRIGKRNNKPQYTFVSARSHFGDTYDGITKTSRSGFRIVKKDGKWGIVNSNNLIVLPICYDRIRLVKDNDFKVKKDNKWTLLSF